MAKLVGAAELANMPWEDRPADSSEIVWRFSGNPVIKRDLAARSNSIFNSAVVPWKGGFAGVFRCDDTSWRMNLRRGFSADGLNWTIDDDPIEFKNDMEGLPPSDYKYDPRVVSLEGRNYVTWCNGYHGPCIGAGYTDDFETFVQMENVFMPYNRNGVLFPRKIDGRFAMLSRPSDTGHTAFGDIFYSESPDFVYWGRHRHVMSPTPFEESAWQFLKIGAGPAPIETDEGWLLIYHGVLKSCNGFIYSFGAALLDIDEPWKVIARGRPYLLNPRMMYECAGDVPNVVFPCAALTDAASGRMAIYYGAADTVTCLAFARVEEVVEFVKSNDML